MTNNTPTTNIYQLIDPRTGDVFYIGQAVNPAKRLEQHINDARPNDKRQRIADMLADGVEPVLQVVEVVARKDADKAERRRIKELDGLTNKNHNGKKRKRNRRKKPKTAHLVPAVRAYHAKERKSREVPEIAQASWKKIKPMLDKSNAVSTHELSEWAEVTQGWVMSQNWPESIAKHFPNIWEVKMVNNGKVGRPIKMLIRKL